MDPATIRRFRHSLRQFERLTSAQLKGCCGGVSLTQCLVLMEIDSAGELTMSELAARIRVDNSTLTRTIDGLVQRGLVERRRDDRDRRVIRIALTAAGDSVCGGIHADNDAFCAAAFDRIPPSRRGTVIRSFETLVQAFLDCETDASPVCMDAADKETGP